MAKKWKTIRRAYTAEEEEVKAKRRKAMMMQDFPLGDILSVTTGHLVSRDHSDGLYRILNYMTEDDLYTHQLPKAAEECRPRLLKQHPQLAEVEVPAQGWADADAVYAWLDEQERIYGETLPVQMYDVEAHDL